ncbi:MAG: hypothetical protein ACJA0M_002552, partial [Chitinophagales bacterium]
MPLVYIPAITQLNLILVVIAFGRLSVFLPSNLSVYEAC